MGTVWTVNDGVMVAFAERRPSVRPGSAAKPVVDPMIEPAPDEVSRAPGMFTLSIGRPKIVDSSSAFS